MPESRKNVCHRWSTMIPILKKEHSPLVNQYMCTRRAPVLSGYQALCRALKARWSWQTVLMARYGATWAMYGHVMMSMWPLLHLLLMCLRARWKSSMGKNRGRWRLQGCLSPRHLRSRSYHHHWTMESKPPPLPLLGYRPEFRNQHVWIGSRLKSAVHFFFFFFFFFGGGGGGGGEAMCVLCMFFATVYEYLSVYVVLFKGGGL